MGKVDYERDMRLYTGIIAALAGLAGAFVGIVAYWSMV